MHQIDVSSWEHFKEQLLTLEGAHTNLRGEGGGCVSSFLYRGQSDSSWGLAPTLERADRGNLSLRQYYRLISAVKPQVEALTGTEWSAPGCAEYEAWYLVNALGRRLADLFFDLVDSLERRRLAVSALSARAVVETSAAIVYAEERIVGTLERKITSPTEADLETLVSFLHRMAGGARFDWLSWHRSAANRAALLEQYETAQSVKDEPEPDESIRAVNVMTMIKRLDARFLQFARSVGETKCSGAIVRATYAMLSDHCHPASGAYMLYLDPTAVPHGHCFTSDPTDETLRRFFREMMGYVAPIGNIADQALIAIGEAANRFAAQAGCLPSSLDDWRVKDN